jgi:hypothetical protein
VVRGSRFHRVCPVPASAGVFQPIPADAGPNCHRARVLAVGCEEFLPHTVDGKVALG